MWCNVMWCEKNTMRHHIISVHDSTHPPEEDQFLVRDGGKPGVLLVSRVNEVLDLSNGTKNNKRNRVKNNKNILYNRRVMWRWPSLRVQTGTCVCPRQMLFSQQSSRTKQNIRRKKKLYANQRSINEFRCTFTLCVCLFAALHPNIRQFHRLPFHSSQAAQNKI